MKDGTNARGSDKRLHAPVNRRDGIKLAAAGAMASLLPAFAQATTRTKSKSTRTQKDGAMSDGTAIRPFHYEASKDDLADLKRRVAATRWPDKETVSDQSQGVQLHIARKIQEHWARHD